MIRPFEVADTNQLIDLLEANAQDAKAEGFAEYNVDKIIAMVKKFANMPNREMLLAVRGQELVGHAMISANPKAWGDDILGEVHLFFVHPDYRNGFVAKDLFDACYEWFRSRDCVCMTSTVQAWDKNYQPCEDWIQNGESFFGKLMQPTGTCYVKEIV